ncbi:MFS transporter [Roseateles sp. DC23W]|uniref:MFS transporter n=1 Tax=Pelomonas dachongensis TaxID=3299029 RepID=A0ABW7EQQ5_9BURK
MSFKFLTLAPGDLLRDAVYRRLWTSILVSSLGGQITLLALPLTAAVLLNASPTQMGILQALEVLPFALFSLPTGVLLDRVRKLPVYIAGEVVLAVAVASVPLAAVLGVLSMGWLYLVGFIIGAVHTTAGSAGQIVLTQVVPRERLVEAHAKNALASSGAEVAGPGVAGLLIKLVGAPLALAVDAVMLALSTLILRGIRVQETLPPRQAQDFWRELKAGLRFVRERELLVSMAIVVAAWNLFHNGALVVQILFATRELKLAPQTVGWSYAAIGLGTVLASVWGHRISKRLGPGPCLVVGFATCGLGWLLLALAPSGPLGVVGFGAMLFIWGVGAVLMFINFLSLRQAVTPAPMLGRMTSTVRWLILLPAAPGALLGGWMGEHLGLRATLAFSGIGCLLVAVWAWNHATLRAVRELPKPVEVLPA